MSVSRVEGLREHLGDLSAGYDDAGVLRLASTSLPNVSFLVAWHVTPVLSVPDDIEKATDARSGHRGRTPGAGKVAVGGCPS